MNIWCGIIISVQVNTLNHSAYYTVTWWCVTIDGSWIGDWIWLLDTGRDYTSHFTITHTSVHSHVFTSRCLVAASNGGRSPSSEFLNWPRPQLPTSTSNSSQRLNPSNPLTATESESYVTTDGQSAGLSWNKALIWGLRPHFYYWQLRVCWCLAFSQTRGLVCRLKLLLALTSAVILGSESLGTRLATIFCCLRFETSLFVASYDSQG
jgi:hypothetical protein